MAHQHIPKQSLRCPYLYAREAVHIFIGVAYLVCGRSELHLQLLACFFVCPANSSASEIWVHEGWHSCAMRAPVISGFVVLRPARSTLPVSCCSSSRALSRASTSHWFRNVRSCCVLGAVALQLTHFSVSFVPSGPPSCVDHVSLRFLHRLVVDCVPLLALLNVFVWAR